MIHLSCKSNHGDLVHIVEPDSSPCQTLKEHRLHQQVSETILEHIPSTSSQCEHMAPLEALSLDESFQELVHRMIETLAIPAQTVQQNGHILDILHISLLDTLALPLNEGLLEPT